MLMNCKQLVVAVAVALSTPWKAEADDAPLRMRVLRELRKMVRSSPQGDVTVLKNKNFDGIWGGRYFYSPRASTCGSPISSFDFRHLLATRGVAGALSTSHDGNFAGRSRDKGRRWEFGKTIPVNGRSAVILVGYASLARNGNSAATAYGLRTDSGCILTFGANAIRLAR
jgi:hypothetical protein